MNKERVIETANYLASLKDHAVKYPGINLLVGFNMDSYMNPTVYDPEESDKSGHMCGTTACIAGHIALKHWPEEMSLNFTTVADNSFSIAKDYLELNTNEAYSLFTDNPINTPIDDVTIDQAVGVLMHLAETGKVNWNHNNPDYDPDEEFDYDDDDSEYNGY